MAFIRVQNGVFDPSIIGDKQKWYKHQLDSINFKVWNSSNESLKQEYSEFVNKDEDSDEDSDADSDLSSHSSNSSLNELVEEICNTRANYNITGLVHVL